MNKGIVFDIQRFSLNDGPGIRTTVFFKGCGLKCSWCHNPESIYVDKQIKYEEKKCVLCKKCVNENDGIEVLNDKLKIDFNMHNKSFHLIDTCPYNAYSLIGYDLSIDEIIDIVKKDEKYYHVGNGGVTLSGGEALLQKEFVFKLIKKLKEININVTLDISGNNTVEEISYIEPYVDLFLVDIKVTNKELEKKYVGKIVDIEPLLNYIPAKKLNLRCPIIPKINDDLEHFEYIKSMSKKYYPKRIDILPYHNMRKNQKFKRFNKYVKFNEFDKVIEDKVITFFKDNNIENTYYKNKIIY